jgi:small subunit ribosomal protein S6
LRSYDLVYIVKPDLDTETLNAVVERVAQRLAEQHATIEHTDTWGRRRMAYPIQRYREGLYVFVRFSVPGEGIPEIKRTLRITEHVLRASVTQAVGSIAQKAAAQPTPPPPPAATPAQPEPEQPGTPGTN